MGFETEMFRWRIFSHLFYMILMTLFVHYPMGLPLYTVGNGSSDRIPSFDLRNEFAWTRDPQFDPAPTNLPRYCFLFTWIAFILWPIILLFLKYQNDDNLPPYNIDAVERKPDALYTQENIQPIRELIWQQARLDWSEFLTNIDPDRVDSCELFYECFKIRPEIKQMSEHMTAVFDEVLHNFYMHFAEYMLEEGCKIDFYKHKKKEME